MLRIRTNQVNFIPVFEENRTQEDPFTVELKPLKYADYWDLVAILQEFSKPEAMMEMKKFRDLIQPIFRNYVKLVSGFMIDDRAGTLDDLLDQPGLFGLNAEIMAQLVNISKPDESAKKKLLEASGQKI